jgi:hypothetical protein
MKLLYIMGIGRSGSTVLDTVLGNHSRMDSFGELATFDDAWLTDTRCACMHIARLCSFWSEVHRDWTDRVGEDPTKRHRALRLKFERLHSWPRLLAARRWPTAEFQEYVRSTRALLASIERVSGAEVLVDSSKMPGRGLAFSMIPEIELNLIHLVRDPRAVAWSLQKVREKNPAYRLGPRAKPRSVSWTILYWCLVNIASEQVSRRVRRQHRLFVRYEDMMARPEETVERIGPIVGLDMGELAAALTAGQPMAVNHTIAGNRLRLAGSIKLRADDEWVAKLPGRDRRAVEILIGWHMRRYGYGRSPAAPGGSDT